MPQLLDLPPHELTPNPKNPRNLPLRDEDLSADERADLVRLGESMQGKQLQPILAHPVKQKKVIVAGHRRLLAAKIVGLATVQVLLADNELSEVEALSWAIQENTLREDMKPWELFTSFSALMDMNPSWQMKDLADFLKLSPATVTRNLSPLKLSEDWLQALKAGNLTLSHCYNASKADKSKRPGLLALALSGANREAIYEAGRTPCAKKSDAVGAQRVRCDLPGGVSVVVSGQSVSLDESIEALNNAIKEMKRARDLGYTAKTFAAAMRDKAKVG